MQLSQRDRAAIIARLDRIDEERQAILDLLLPPDDDVLEEAGCPHPADAIEDRSTMGEERYVCTLCTTEFPHDPRTIPPER